MTIPIAGRRSRNNRAKESLIELLVLVGANVLVSTRMKQKHREILTCPKKK